VFANEAGPAQACCNGAGPNGSNFCMNQTADAAMCAVATVDGGSVAIEACNDTWDCPTGQICCLYVLSVAPPVAHTACQAPDAGYTCNGSMGDVQAQICKSDNECPSGACHIYSCLGDTIYSCANPLASLCTLVTVTGSGSGS
jgi:hypothetical protein